MGNSGLCLPFSPVSFVSGRKEGGGRKEFNSYLEGRKEKACPSHHSSSGRRRIFDILPGIVHSTGRKEATTTLLFYSTPPVLPFCFLVEYLSHLPLNSVIMWGKVVVMMCFVPTLSLFLCDLPSYLPVLEVGYSSFPLPALCIHYYSDILPFPHSWENFTTSYVLIIFCLTLFSSTWEEEIYRPHLCLQLYHHPSVPYPDLLLWKEEGNLQEGKKVFTCHYCTQGRDYYPTCYIVVPPPGWKIVPQVPHTGRKEGRYAATATGTFYLQSIPPLPFVVYTTISRIPCHWFMPAFV